MEYMMTGNCNCGLDARIVLARYILKKSQTAQTVAAEELYPEIAAPGLGPLDDGEDAGAV